MAKHTQRTQHTQYASQAARKKSHGSTLVGLFIGLVIGLLCAFGVAWYMQKSPFPFQDKASRAERNDAQGTAQQSSAPLQLPGKPGDKTLNGPGEKPRFEFYKILPGGEVAPPQPGNGQAPQDQAAANTAQPAEGQPAPIVESFYLQAGAFQKSVDADNLKAKLALMGLETSVLEANVPDKGLMYRVRVGPFAKPEEMNRARNQLSQNGIQASVIKIKEKPAPAQQTQ